MKRFFWLRNRGNTSHFTFFTWHKTNGFLTRVMRSTRLSINDGCGVHFSSKGPKRIASIPDHPCSHSCVLLLSHTLCFCWTCLLTAQDWSSPDPSPPRSHSATTGAHWASFFGVAMGYVFWRLSTGNLIQLTCDLVPAQVDRTLESSFCGYWFI